MQPGQVVQLDHADDGSGRYLGYSRQRCNASAGAARGNRMRAAAYRAMRGMGASNGQALAPQPPPPEQPKCPRTREEINALVKATGQLPCICGRTVSRCW